MDTFLLTPLFTNFKYVQFAANHRVSHPDQFFFSLLLSPGLVLLFQQTTIKQMDWFLYSTFLLYLSTQCALCNMPHSHIHASTLFYS